MGVQGLPNNYSTNTQYRGNRKTAHLQFFLERVTSAYFKSFYLMFWLLT